MNHDWAKSTGDNTVVLLEPPQSEVIPVPAIRTDSLMGPGLFSAITATLVRHVVETALKGGYPTEIESAWKDVLRTATPNDLDVLAHSEVIMFVKEQIYKHPLVWGDTKLYLLATCGTEVVISGKKRRGGGNDEWLLQIARWTQDSTEMEALARNPTPYVRESLANNEYLHREVELILAKDSLPRIREVIAHRTNDLEILLELLADPDERVCLAAGARNLVPTIELEKRLIWKHFPSRGFVLLLKRIDIQTSTLSKIVRDIRKLSLDDPLRMTTAPLLAMHPSSSSKVRREFWWEAKEQVFGYDHHVPF